MLTHSLTETHLFDWIVSSSPKLKICSAKGIKLKSGLWLPSLKEHNWRGVTCPTTPMQSWPEENMEDVALTSIIHCAPSDSIKNWSYEFLFTSTHHRCKWHDSYIQSPINITPLKVKVHASIHIRYHYIYKHVWKKTIIQ